MSAPPMLALSTVVAALPAMRARGVSEVARGPGGFVAAYRRAGSAADLPDEWKAKRAAFLARHLAQMENNGWEEVSGESRPTRQHLALVAWAYSPTPERLRSYLARERSDVDAAAVTGDAAPMTIRAHRIDRMTAGLLQPVTAADGSRWYEGRAARPGVHVYRDADGREIRELVTAETLGRVDDLATLAGAPVTLLHPPVMVDPDNWGDYADGTVASEVEQEAEGGFVRVKLRAARRRALDAIETGEAQELSCGYVAEIREQGGTHPEFGAYDREQISRVYNHLALVPKGRHGPAVRLRADGAVMRLDGADPWQVQRLPATSHTDQRPAVARSEEDMINRALILGLLVAHKDDAGAAADAIVGALPKIDMSEKEIEDMMAENQALKDEIKAIKDKMNEEKGDTAPTLAQRRAAALDRAALEQVATRVKIDKIDELDDADLRAAVVRSVRGDALPADAAPAVIEAHWQIIRDQKRDGVEGWSTPAEQRTDAAAKTSRLSPLDHARLAARRPAKT